MENKTQWKLPEIELLVDNADGLGALLLNAGHNICRYEGALLAALDLLEETMQIIETAEKVIKADSRYAAAFEGTGLHIRIKKHRDFLTQFKPTT